MVTACGGPRPVIVEEAPTEVVRRPLSKTRFVAYGDSVTEGLLLGCPGRPAPVPSIAPDPPATPGVRSSTPSGVSFPARLAALLHERYAGQPIELIGEGVGSDSLSAFKDELGRVLVGDGPDVLLLAGGGDALRAGASGDDVVAALQSMIRDAKRRGVVVFVATLLPIDVDGCRPDAPPVSREPVIRTNAALRTMVGTEEATLVDLFEAFNGRTGVLLGSDGARPTASGFALIARLFFEAITRQLEGE